MYLSIYLSIYLSTQLHYAQLVTSGVGKQKDNVTQALKDSETKIREFLSCKTRSDPNDGFSTWLSEDKSDNDDIKWLLESGKKKVVFDKITNPIMDYW